MGKSLKEQKQKQAGEDVYRQIFVSIENAASGEFIFVEANRPDERRNFPEKIKKYGLKESIHYIDVSKDLPHHLPFHIAVSEWLKCNREEKGTILALDGFENIFSDEKKAIEWLETFNFSREALAAKNLLFIFLMPAFCINLVRRYAPDLWAWRAFYFQIQSDEDQMKAIPIYESGMDSNILPGDTPEKRNSRIKILKKMLKQELGKHGQIEPVLESVLLPLGKEQLEAGQYHESEKTLKKADAWIRKHPDSKETAQIYTLRGEIEYYLGRMALAREFFQNAMEIYERIYGSEHSRIAQILNNLAMVYNNQIDHIKAWDCMYRAIEIDEKIYGAEHPSVARDLNNIGMLFKDMGDYPRALEKLKRSLQINEKIYGSEHPQIAINLNNIANVLQDKGDFASALDYLERALNMNKKLLGPEHPQVSKDMNNLAINLFLQGKMKEARKLLKRAREISLKTLGKDNPHTMTVSFNLLLCNDEVIS